MQIEELFLEKSNLAKAASRLQSDYTQTKQLYEEALDKIEAFKEEVAVKDKIKL